MPAQSVKNAFEVQQILLGLCVFVTQPWEGSNESVWTYSLTNLL